MSDLTAEDFNISRDITSDDIAFENDLRNSGQKSPDYYEHKPVFDHEYYGPRFKYGLKNGSYNVATVPKGEILNSDKSNDKEYGSLFGTIEYPYALTEEQITNFQLIDFQTINSLSVNVGEEGYNTWYDTEEQAATAIKSMRNNGINADRVAQAYDSNSDNFKYKIYRSQEEVTKLNDEFRIKQENIQATEKAATDALLADKNNIDGFGSEQTPMQLGRTIAALNKAVQVDGKPTTIKAVVKKLVESGELTSTELHDVIKPMTRLQSFRANQQEQDAHEKKIKDAGKKTVYYVGDYNLGKTAYDYAQYLINSKSLDTATLNSMNFKQIAHNIIDHDVFRLTVTDTIQNDGQKVLDAIFREDVEALISLNNKYAKEAGRNQGGGGAGPGKPKQPRRGAESVYNASLIAINGFKELNNMPPLDPAAENPRMEAKAWRELGDKVAFNLPPNGSVMRPTQADFKYAAIKLGISEANALRAWNFKMGDIEMPKTKAPEVVEIVAPVALDPAAQKYLDDRQQHNDQADEHKRLRRVGQEALPGIRFQDAADVGRVYESFKKGDLTDQQWNDYTADLISSNKVTPQPTREDYEAKPPFDDEYTGPRFKYGMRNRPFGIATAPKGAILMTYKPEDKESGSRHGTVEYPFQLTKEDVANYELVDFPAIKQQAIDFSVIASEYVKELQSRDFVTNAYASNTYEASSNGKNELFVSGTSKTQPELVTSLHQSNDTYLLKLNSKGLTHPIVIEYQTPADINIERSLKWIDKELAKADTLFESKNVRIDLASPFTDFSNKNITATDKIKTLALTLAKHQDETLSYNELVTKTGLTKTEIDEYWIAAQTIANNAIKDANAKDLSYQIDRHTHLFHSGPPMVIYSQSESNIQDEPMFWSNATGWGSLSEKTSTFTKGELDAVNIIHITTSGQDAVSMPYEQAQQLVVQDKENHKHDGAYIKGQIILNHAHGLKNACELRLKNDPQKYDFAAEQHKLDQADYIITNINQHSLKNDVFKLDYQAAMGGNPLAHDHEDRRQSIITQIDTFKKDLEQLSPEANLRDLWTKQGVSKERQDALIADVTAKALMNPLSGCKLDNQQQPLKPGAMVGPFVIPHKLPSINPRTTTPQTGGNTMENPATETVPASTEYDFTGARLAEKLNYLEKTQSTKLAYLEKHLNDFKTMPESTESTNRKTGEIIITTKAQALANLARKEAIDAMSKGEYVSNIIEMGKINKKRASGEISSEDIQKHAAMKAVDIKLAAKEITPEAAAEAKNGYVPNTLLVRFDKINSRNAKLGKEFTYKHETEKLAKKAFMEANPTAKKEDIPVGPASKAFNAAFYFNCTEDGIKDQIQKVTKKHDITTNLLAKISEVPDCKFVVTIKEQRNLPNLSYDQKFLKQLDEALTAKNTPAPAAPEQTNKPKPRSRK